MHESTLSALLLDCFQRIVVINLPERADRRRGIAAELRKVGLSLDHPRVVLFSARRPDAAAGFRTVGEHGAFLSHLAVMERAQAEGWSRVLVLEDDMAWTRGALHALPGLARALSARPWAVVYGHAGDDPSARSAPDADGLVTLSPQTELIRLHFLGLERAAMQALIPEMRAMLGRAPGSPLGGPMPCDGALNWVRRARPDLIALAAHPPVARQRPSRSDIAPARWFDRWPVLRTLAGLARQLRA